MSEPEKNIGSTKKGKSTSTKKESNVDFLASTSFFTDMYRHQGFSDVEIKKIRDFESLDSTIKQKRARELIQASIIEKSEEPDILFSLALEQSKSEIEDYLTLDDYHRKEIQKLIQQIEDYLLDKTRKRPLNVLMIATPGAGKSHFIKQLAKSMKDVRIEAVTYNMATMQSTDDLAQPVDELRNIKVNDKYPLLFLDEFDSNSTNYSTLLPLLWDGDLQIGHRDLQLGKAVIILAGSNPELPKLMDQSSKMLPKSEPAESVLPASKLFDLMSRINGGVIKIPDLDLHTKDRDRRVDKVCISVSLLQSRFSGISDVPLSLLSFIANTSFRYGVRSLAHLIELIKYEAFSNNVLSPSKLGLPIESEEELQESSLKFHFVDKDQGFGIVNRWHDCSKSNKMLKVKTPLHRIFFDDIDLSIV